MRFALPLLSLLLLCAVPRIAPAQQRALPVVDLDTVESSAETPPRSAFGRVMDVMIAALVEQQAQQQGQAPAARRQDAGMLPPAASRHARATRRATTPSPRDPEPSIRISLGDRFALPPAESVSRADVPE